MKRKVKHALKKKIDHKIKNYVHMYTDEEFAIVILYIRIYMNYI